MRKKDQAMSTTTEAMVAAAKAVVPSTTAQEVQAKLQADQPVVVLDVREKEEYDQGHIAQAKLLPRGLLEFRIRDVIPDQSTTIILH
jgi:rhodanese-related sulfurtransferase